MSAGPPPAGRISKFITGMLVSILCGMRAREWWPLLWRQRFAIDPPYWPRALALTGYSTVNSVLAACEELRFGARIRKMNGPAPVFILGHWRSGTTHLHNLMACDPQLVAPSLHQALFPHTFLTTESWLPDLYGRVLPEVRKFDNMPLSPHLPAEDEFALNILTGGLSPYMAYTWPRDAGRFDRYLTMREASDAERALWSAALRRYVAKLHFASGRMPVLKSPPHTARLWLLHRIFPDARFIHVHRHPEQVFQSMRAMMLVARYLRAALQRRRRSTDDELFDQFEKLHASYFEYRDQVPAGQLVEIPYARLVAEPLKCLGDAYEQLGMTGFAAAEPHMRQHLAMQSDYRRNQHRPLSRTQRRRLAEAARLCCAVWGYTIAKP